MKKINLLVILTAIVFIGCKEKVVTEEQSMTVIEKAAAQYEHLYHNAISYMDSDRPMPRTIVNGKLHTVGVYDWTSGFHPGSMWNLYGLTNDITWKNRAVAYTQIMDTIQYYEGTHDLGFMIGDSYGNALKYMDKEAYEKVMVQAAKSLVSRFKPKAGVIQSWNSNDRWQCPVIIDNMMNLEMLFEATKISGDSTFYNVAIMHADTTMAKHFRADYSSYHVLDYDTETGKVLKRNTAQGYKDESAWARGQAWGLYGYIVMYRETKDEKYLDQSKNIASFIMNHSNLPEDKIPYWDYDAPVTKDTPRDASAAAITASALFELSTYVEDDLKNTYVDRGNSILESLSKEPYFAEIGTNEGFILKHSTGHKPQNSEIDVPLNYADYYFLEALLRQRDMIK
ncbi:glycoside hydrolase family 88 protein [Maribacter confluentis]|uniref:Glycoside hydrolase family 88 protein n=1 Tax=Maribacter confluentis TaxID=1656093 RepID=A0ABT8RTB7_9FLAO|nr:glycoside hydrolase family 88 protein [Maribacter confluentis]MDO1514133.1 glycoside hydrolase family 88 protein [Maribacter confluentis]